MLKKSIACVLLLTAATGAMAQSATGRVQITAVYTGWSTNAFNIATSATSIVNPAGCPSADLYATDGSIPGFNLYYAAALTALQNRQPVEVIISNTKCSNGRPEIIGITLIQN